MMLMKNNSGESMEYNIYLDVFFLRNFVMNFLCLKSVGIIVGRSCSWKKEILGAFIGTMCNTIVVLNHIFVPGMTLLIAELMCSCVFGYGSWFRNQKIVCFLFFIAFGMDGIVSWFQFDAAVLLIPIICMMFGREKRRREQEIKVTLYFKGRKKELVGFYDSGNMLTEPLTGKMVHIVCYDKIKDLLPKEYRQVAEQYLETELFEDTKVTKLQMYEFTFLSYHSIGKENGQLLGIRMDSAEFETHAGKKTEEKVLIGLTKQRLFLKGRDRMIVNGRMEL